MSTWHNAPSPPTEQEHDVLPHNPASSPDQASAADMAGPGDVGHPAEAEPGLPTMADLDGLATQLDAIDATLARLDAGDVTSGSSQT